MIIASEESALREAPEAYENPKERMKRMITRGREKEKLEERYRIYSNCMAKGEQSRYQNLNGLAGGTKQIYNIVCVMVRSRARLYRCANERTAPTYLRSCKPL